jgi:UTP-glucose-1-phosphate uridylyltransferase
MTEITILSEENFVDMFDGTFALSKEVTKEEKQKLLETQKKLQKVLDIINIDTVGWASPKVLIDTLKREVFEK